MSSELLHKTKDELVNMVSSLQEMLRIKEEEAYLAASKYHITFYMFLKKSRSWEGAT
jgi:hypothetical protein